MDEFQAVDVPADKLRPLRDRKVSGREYARILASLRAVGLIEPLVVFPDGDGYVILDGAQRFRALAELGVGVVPCLLGKHREAFTGNRMVNRVSPVQETRMIRQSLKELDGPTIAAALGVAGIAHRLKKGLLDRLDPAAVAALDAGRITEVCARALARVKPPRQVEILGAMEGYKDYGAAFARAMVLKTPPPLRAARGGRGDPWDRPGRRRSDLLKRLAEAEQAREFYARLYRQYTVDLLRLAIFARSLLTRDAVRAYLDAHHPAVVARLEAVIADARG